MTELQELQAKLDYLNNKLDVLLTASAKNIIKREFYECLDDWYKIYKLPNLCAGSLRSLRNVIRLLKQHIPNKQVFELRPIDFEKCLNALSPTKTRKDIYIYSREFLRFAFCNKFIAEDISVFIKAPRYKAKEGVAYSQEQIKAIFDNITNNDVLILFQFYYLTGVRRSEALSVRWCDVDFTTKTIHIHGTKTISSNRYIPLTTKLAKLIKTIPYTSADDTLFNATYAGIRWEVEQLKKKLKININIKNFRTTFATRCADIGIAPRVVQAWLGHTDVRTTNKYYIKATPNLNEREITLFNRYF